MKLFRILVLIFTITILGCVDNGQLQNSSNSKTDLLAKITNPPYPGPYKTILKDGVDYIQARGEIGKYGGTLYTSTIGQGPQTFNPWVSKDSTSSQMGELMFDSLFSTDSYTGKVIPQIAKDYSVSNDNKEYTVKLRKGLRWSDGKPISIDDVVFTWNNIVKAGLGNPSSRDNLLVDGEFPQISVIDKYTLKFRTKKPFAPFLRQLGSIPIAPKHIMEAVTKKGDKYFNSFWGADADPKDFVVSGKFILSQYETGQRVEFVKNPYYYIIDKAGNKLPYLDNYVVYIVGELNNEILKFEANEIDILSIPGANVAKLKENEQKKGSNFKIYNLGPTTATTFIAFNLNNRKDKKTNKSYVNPIKQEWFRNIAFRKAVDWAVDRKNIINNVVQGVGAPLFTSEGLSSIFLNNKISEGHPRDLNKAKEFLKDDGFVLKNNKLYDNKGNMVKFNLFTNAGNTEREAIGVIVKEDLEKLGMKVNFKPIEFNALVAKLTNSLDWDATIIGLTGNSLEPHSGRNVWNSDGTLHLFNQRYGSDAKNKVGLLPFEKNLDQLFEQGASTLNLDERKKLYNQYQEVVYDNLPLVYLYSPLNIIAVRNRLGNVKPTILGGVAYNLEEIYIKDNKN